MIAFIPSPHQDALHIGALQIRAYGVCIAVGILVSVSWAERRWERGGGEPGGFARVAGWAVPGGIIGARLYHVVTDFQLYRHNLFGIVKIWAGGLGIWGGVAGGVVAGAICARRWKLSFPGLLDAVAPALPLAQAIGRLGNYFNQELFGRPTRLPWALHIDAVHRPLGYEQYSTFHPTFLYEALWNLIVVIGVVLLVERRHVLRRGYLFAVYVMVYCLGRFFTEYLRIDEAHRFLGLRLNDWTSVVLFVGAAAFVMRGRRRSKTDEADTDQLSPV